MAKRTRRKSVEDPHKRISSGIENSSVEQPRQLKTLGQKRATPIVTSTRPTSNVETLTRQQTMLKSPKV